MHVVAPDLHLLYQYEIRGLRCNMRNVRVYGVILGVWIAAVATSVALVAHGQSQERAALIDRFEARAETGSAFIAAYVQDIFDLERRLAGSMESGPRSDASLARNAELAGFTAAVLLDNHGRVIAVAPADATMRGVELASQYPHLASALEGEPTVSGVVLSAVDKTPIVAFALPLDDGRGGVLSGGFSFGDSPLKAFLARQPIAGTQAHIVDAAGVPAVSAGDNAMSPQEDTFDEQLQRGPVFADGRVSVEAEIAGTPWRLMLRAPVDSVTAPATENDDISWMLLIGLALLAAFGLGVMGRTLVSRARLRESRAQADQRFRMTLEHAPIGMTMVRLDSRFLEPNQQLCRMLGYEAEQLQE